MSALSNELADIARSIVRGEEPSSWIDMSYSNYSADIAIEVYRNNYRGNLHDTLAGAYPVTEQLVGKDFFRYMTRLYIGQHPSRSGNLHHYGMQLPDFIAAFEPAKGLVYLPDVAALEWACHRAYFADNDVALDVGKLAQVHPNQYSDLILYTHQSCHQVRSHYPVAAIWHAHQPGASEDFHIDLDSGSCNALVSRKNDVVLVCELSDADSAWLQGIQAGISLGDATADTLEHYPDFNLQAALLQLVELDVLSNFKLGVTK